MATDNFTDKELRDLRLQELLPDIEWYIEEFYEGEEAAKPAAKPRGAAKLAPQKAAKKLCEKKIKEDLVFEENMMASEETVQFSIADYSSAAKRRIEDVLAETKETFSQALLRIITQKNLKDSDVYNRAGISRQLFSKIRKEKDYQPTKKTVVALAFAMQLNIDEATDLLNKAGLSLSPSKKEDLVVRYFFEEEEYDIFLINEVLDHFNLPTLF